MCIETPSYACASLLVLNLYSPPMSNITLSDLKDCSCCRLTLFSNPSNPIPDIREDIPGKKLSTILLLKPIISKFLPPR